MNAPQQPTGRTPIPVGTAVQILGGFEDGILGRVATHVEDGVMVRPHVPASALLGPFREGRVQPIPRIPRGAHVMIPSTETPAVVLRWVPADDSPTGYRYEVRTPATQKAIVDEADLDELPRVPVPRDAKMRRIVRLLDGTDRSATLMFVKNATAKVRLQGGAIVSMPADGLSVAPDLEVGA